MSNFLNDPPDLMGLCWYYSSPQQREGTYSLLTLVVVTITMIITVTVCVWEWRMPLWLASFPLLVLILGWQGWNEISWQWSFIIIPCPFLLLLEEQTYLSWPLNWRQIKHNHFPLQNPVSLAVCGCNIRMPMSGCISQARSPVLTPLIYSVVVKWLMAYPDPLASLRIISLYS